MFVSPAARRGRRALSALILLLLCLLAGAGCAARDRSAAVLTAPVPLAPPTSTPTFTPTPTVPSPAPGLPTFKTVAAPDQTVLQSLAAAWAIDAERGPSAARLDAMQPYCRPHTPRAHWWVCTNDEGRVTALDLSFVQAGGEILSELRGLSALRYLNLSSNQLTALPPELGQLQNLTLDLQQLTSLNWANPEPALDLNQLTSLPPELGQLQNLTTLYLPGNQLTSLPPELGQLQSLELLYLDHNQLTSLPPELGQLTNLTTLYLTENPLTGCLPAGWRDQGIKFWPSAPPPFCTE